VSVVYEQSVVDIGPGRKEFENLRTICTGFC